MKTKQGAFNKSISNLKEALRYAITIQDKYIAYNNLAVCYSALGDYVTAVTYLDSAIKDIQQQTGKKKPESIVNCYNNLAVIYLRFGQQSKALTYLDEGEAIARENGFFNNGFCSILNAKGTILQEIGKKDSALKCFKEALKFGIKNKDIEVIVLSEIGLGDLLASQNKYRNAVDYLQQARIQSYKEGVADLWITASYSLGGAFYQLKKYNNAIITIESAIQKASEINFNDDILDAYQTLAKAYEANNQFKEALKTERIWLQMKDSMMSVEKTKAINDLELKYRTAQKNKELAENGLQLAKKERDLAKKNLWIGGIILLFLSAGSIATVRYRNARKLQRQRIRRLEQERELLEQKQELVTLQSMISGEEQERRRIGRELHDGIGGLLSVVRIRFSSLKKKHRELQNQDDFKEIVELLDEATGELRKTAHNLMPEALLKAGLLEAVKIFCERVRRGNDINLQVSSYGETPELDPLLELSLYRIIQELVQNIIKHAGASVAQVQFNWKEESFTIMVEDNGAGMKEEEGDKGIGLENTMARMKALQGAMHIDSTVGVGTTVWLEFFREG